ncbi:MAG: hypothetical protein QM503_05110 [Bacteroidota bacterium]
MKDSIANITKWILYLLLVLSVVPGVLFYAGLLDTEIFINWAKILLIVAAIVMVISPIYGFIINPQNMLKMIISIVGMVVVVGIAYMLAGNEFTSYRLEELNATIETSKLVGMGLIATYIAFGLTIIAIFYSSVVKLFK